jgi:hypothetical protein
MSSWERSRFIPWTHIPAEGSNLTQTKERIFRDLQREAVKQQREQQLEGTAAAADGKSITLDQKIPFQWMDMFKQMAFGACIGGITGSVFGFMDGMRTAGESAVLKNASNMAKGKYLFQGTTRSATVFGVFFGGFHTLKYGIKVNLDPGEFAEIGLAGAISMGALMYKPAYRASMPYASMLIIMDSVHIIMRQFED